jgi:hypothetical protein
MTTAGPKIAFKSLADEQRRLSMDSEELPHLLKCGSCQCRGKIGRRIIHQDVYAGESTPKFRLDHVGRFLGARQIDADCQAISADRLRPIYEFLRFAMALVECKCDIKSLAGQMLNDRSPDAAGATGDQRYAGCSHVKSITICPTREQLLARIARLSVCMGSLM